MTQVKMTFPREISKDILGVLLHRRNKEYALTFTVSDALYRKLFSGTAKDLLHAAMGTLIKEIEGIETAATSAKGKV